MIKKRTVELPANLGGLGQDNGAGGVTAKIRKLQNGVTRLIQGSPDYKVPNCKLIAKAIAQSDSLIMVDFDEVSKKMPENQLGEMKEGNTYLNEDLDRLMTMSAQELLPYKYNK